MQSLQQQTACKTIDELVAAVEETFLFLQTKKLNNVFLTLQKVMETIILKDGGNEYKLPHMSKEKLEQNGELPVLILVSDELLQKLEQCAYSSANYFILFFVFFKAWIDYLFLEQKNVAGTIPSLNRGSS